MPNNDNASNSGSGQPGSGPTQSTTSKHLESLQSVREALFSQDGWGGDNVKQDNAWDIDGKSSTAAVAPVPETPQVNKLNLMKNEPKPMLLIHTLKMSF